jgi:hypothetical protein
VIHLDKFIKLPIAYPDIEYNLDHLLETVAANITSEVLVLEGLLTFAAFEVIDCLDYKVMCCGREARAIDTTFDALFERGDLFAVEVGRDDSLKARVE